MATAHIQQTQSYGDLRVFFQYVNDEPAMVLGAVRFGRRRACVIGLSSAFKYADDLYLMQQAAKFGEVLGLGTDRSTVYRIASAIDSNLPELVKMPPEDPKSQAAIVQRAIEEHGLIIKADGKTVLGD